MPKKKETKKKENQKMKIENFTINRAMGESFDWKKLDINKKHIDALNEIGYSGKFKGKKISIHDYFEKNIDCKGLKHNIEQLSSNNMEFTDKLLVTRVRF